MLYTGDMSQKKIPNLNAIQTTVNDPARLTAVKAVQRLELHRDPAFARLIKQATQMLSVPVALISLVDQGMDHIINQTGIPKQHAKAGRIDAQPSFCELTIAQDSPVIIDDAANHPTLRLFPSVQYMGVRAHLGIPLHYNGQAIGNCCVIDYKPRHWTAEDVKILTDLAQTAMKQINSQSINQTSLL